MSLNAILVGIGLLLLCAGMVIAVGAARHTTDGTCRYCHYDLRAHVQGRCPECGLGATDAARARRRDRRRRLTAAAGVSFIGGGALVTPFVSYQFPRFLPNGILVRLAIANASHIGREEKLRPEMIRRMTANALDDDSLAIYAHRLLENLNGAGELIRARSMWPAAESPRIQIASWRELYMLGHIRIQIHTLEGRELFAREWPSMIRATYQPSLDWDDTSVAVPWSAVRNGELVALARVCRIREDGSIAALGDEMVRLPLVRSTSVRDIMSPKACDLQTLIEVRAIRMASGVAVWFASDHVCPPSGVAIGCRLGLLSNGVPLDSAAYWHSRERSKVYLRLPADWPDDGTELVVRVVSDASLALRDFSADVYWAGEAFIPVADLRTHGTQAPAR